jgi:hypothetical protein
MRERNEPDPSPLTSATAAGAARLPAGSLAAGVLAATLLFAGAPAAWAITCADLGTNAQPDTPTAGDCTITGPVTVSASSLDIVRDLIITSTGQVNLSVDVTINVGNDLLHNGQINGSASGQPGKNVTIVVGQDATINGVVNTQGGAGQPGGHQTYEIDGNFTVAAGLTTAPRIISQGMGGGAGGDVTATVGGDAVFQAASGFQNAIQTGGGAVDFTVDGLFDLQTFRVISTGGSPGAGATLTSAAQAGLDGGPFTLTTQSTALFAGRVVTTGGAGGNGNATFTAGAPGGAGAPISVLACSTLQTISGAEFASNGGNGGTNSGTTTRAAGGAAANQSWHSDGDMTLASTTSFRATGGNAGGANGQFTLTSAGTVTNNATFNPAGPSIQSGVATQCAEPGITKELTSGPDNDGDSEIDLVVEVGRTSLVTATSPEGDVPYDFTITYTPDEDSTPVVVLDALPAEWWVVEVNGVTATNGCIAGGDPTSDGQEGTFSVALANGNCTGSTPPGLGATNIEWYPDVENGSRTLVVHALPRQIPSRSRTQPPRYHPNACGGFRLNDGAVAFEIDELGEIVDITTPLFGPTDAITLIAVDVPDAEYPRDGSGDSDGDGFTDAEEVEAGTDPCDDANFPVE